MIERANSPSIAEQKRPIVVWTLSYFRNLPNNKRYDLIRQRKGFRVILVVDQEGISAEIVAEQYKNGHGKIHRLVLRGGIQSLTIDHRLDVVLTEDQLKTLPLNQDKRKRARIAKNTVFDTLLTRESKDSTQQVLKFERITLPAPRTTRITV